MTSKTKAPLTVLQKAKVDLIKELINATKGKFFTVHFIKTDGSERVMNCRTGVKKHLKGGKSTTKQYDHLQTVYEGAGESYKCINLTTVTKLVINGVEFTFLAL